MSTSLLFPYSPSPSRTSNPERSIACTSPRISLSSFNYTTCQAQSIAPLLKTRRYSPQPFVFAEFTPESKIPSIEPEPRVNRRECLTIKEISPTLPINFPCENHDRREILSLNNRLASCNKYVGTKELPSYANFIPKDNQQIYSESSCSVSPLSPLFPRTSNIATFATCVSPPLNINYNHQNDRLKKSQSTLIMPSLLTLLRPESTTTPLPKDLSSRSLSDYSSPSPMVRKCHTMVTLSAGSNSSNSTTTKVMKERKSRFCFLRRISSSKSAVFSSKSSSSLQSSLRKSPSVTHTLHKYRKNSTGMWPHPEHPNEASSSINDCSVDRSPSVNQSMDGSSEDGRFYAGGCSRCTSTASIFSRRQSTIVNDAVFCKLCLTDVSIREMYQLQQCHCRFCTYCMCMYTSLKIREGESVIECPDFNCDCKGEITLEEVEALVGKELLHLHIKFRKDKEIESDPYKTWCPRPGCDSVVSLPVSKLARKPQSASCPTCTTVFCISCSGTWHPGKSCNAFGGDLQGVPFNEVIKRCPRCKVPIERDAGCAQMQCKKCKHVFCWYCLTSLEDDFLLRHYDKGPCKNKLGHSRASVLWHRAQVVIIFAGFGLLLVIASPLLLFVGPCLLCRSCRPCNGTGSTSGSSIHDSDEGSPGIY